MSDNEDLLADDLGDHNLADYNLGNEEEDQLLADDYESGSSQNVPTSIATYGESVDAAPSAYVVQEIQYTKQRVYHLQPDTGESVVPNITVEVTNPPERTTYAPYEPPPYSEHAVPPAIPAALPESPQIVPTEMAAPLNVQARDRFTSERPVGAQRMPQIRDIPDSLDKVVVPRGGFGPRGRSSWRNPQYNTRFQNTQYRRNNLHRGNFNQRPSFPPPQKFRHNAPQMRPDIRPNPPPLQPDIRPDLPPNIRPEHPDIHPDRAEIRPVIRPDMPPDLRPEFHTDLPPLRPEIPDRPMMPNIPMEPFRPMENRPYRFPNQFRPNMEEPRHFNPNMRPNFEPFPYQRPFRPYPPIREVGPNMNHIPQVTIRHPPPNQMGVPKQEVRMLPVQLPANLPPGGLQGKKVLINPHFKGNFQPPVEGLTMPAYIPTRIQKSPPLSPTLESKFGPATDIDDAAERFIAEQRNALARAANRKFAVRRSPQRFIENNTIEIENDLVGPGAPRNDDDDLLRRQEEFIHANRAGLRRRMRSPSPPRRSPSPSPERARIRVDTARPTDEDSEYRRRMREQEALRERVMRAKEARRRKNAAAAIKLTHDRDRERLEREKETKQATKKETKDTITKEPEPASIQPDTTKKSPERERDRDRVERDRSPVKEDAEVNSTCETLTPPRTQLPASPERALTPPLPKPAAKLEDKRTDSDDDLDLILGDIDGILSDDDDNGRFKEDRNKTEPQKPAVDLRSRLPPKTEKSERSEKSEKSDKKQNRQKIVFESEREDRKRKEKSPPRRTAVTSSTKTEEVGVKKISKSKEKSTTPPSKDKTRSRITFGRKEAEKDKDDAPKPQFSNRRVILQRKVSQQNETKSVFTRIEVKSDPTKPNPGIFSRAVKTALGTDKNRIVVSKKDEPQVEFDSESDLDEDKLLEDELGNTALVVNLPHGMTDTRLKTLAGNDVQSLNMDKEERSAKITFKTTIAAENFKKKFNNKMVAASRLTVSLR